MNGGFCGRCGRTHELPAEAARRACRDLMAKLEAHGRIDFAQPDASPALSAAPLFAPGGGKMLGVLLGLDEHGVEAKGCRSTYSPASPSPVTAFPCRGAR